MFKVSLPRMRSSLGSVWALPVMMFVGVTALWAAWPQLNPLELGEPDEPPDGDPYATAWFNGLVADSWTGGAINSTGDLDYDGYPDLVVGAPDTNYGSIYVVYGSSDGLRGAYGLTGNVTISGSDTSNQFGWALATGDLTGDGKDDLAVGAPGNDGGIGAVYVLPGGGRWSSGAVDDMGSVISLYGEGAAGADAFGYALDVGDIALDDRSGAPANEGVAELLVGAPEASRAYLFFGPLTSSHELGDAFEFRNGDNTRAGESVAILGDINGDANGSGGNDFAIGCPTDTVSGAGPGGKVYLVGGRTASFMPGEPGTYLYLPNDSFLKMAIWGDLQEGNGNYIGHLGAQVVNAGDVDDDGWADVAMSAPSAPYRAAPSYTRAEAGRVYIHFGGYDTLPDQVGDDFTVYISDFGTFFYGEEAYDAIGTRLSPAGDLDGDGRDELLIGAPDVDVIGDGAPRSIGAVYILQGRARSDWPGTTGGTDGRVVDASPNIKFLGQNDSDYLGAGLGGGATGYFDGDGYADFFVGAPGYYVNSGTKGRVYFVSFGDFFDDDVDGQTESKGDCDDTNPNVRVGLDEQCDEIDNDCDGLVDDDDINSTILGQNTYYRDFDGDGYGNEDEPRYTCDDVAPSGYVTNKLDCADRNAAINPSAVEQCDGIDNDCDNKTDDADPSVVGQTIYYEDADFDGYGSGSGEILSSCNNPGPGWSTYQDDCDDGDDEVYPGHDEVCDEKDNDCDNKTDDADNDVVGGVSYWPDDDGDGYGDEDLETVRCAPPSDGNVYVQQGEDCDDSDGSINPGADEVCDGSVGSPGPDNDCDGQADNDPVDGTLYYTDADEDGFGDKNAAAVNLCPYLAPRNVADNNDDCDDADETINPDADEVCDGKDNDCDNKTDDADPNVQGQNVFYRDSDGDDFGDTDLGNALETCSEYNELTPGQQQSYVIEGGDCNDNVAQIHPGADEYCNGSDDDCDGDVDNDPIDGASYYQDEDGDTFGDEGGTFTPVCDGEPVPEDMVPDHSDCDDSDASIYPGAPEGTQEHPTLSCVRGTGDDNDCDGTTDEGTCSYDDDGDGYDETAGDCDDSNSGIYASAAERCDDIDWDCDGAPRDPELYDQDEDGHLDIEDCEGQPLGDDCNDDAPTVYGGADETCDSIDNDCDGKKDEDFDLDEDTYLTNAAEAGCGLRGTDCDDGDASIFPGAEETCDGVDQDCDGKEDEDFDVDTDGYLAQEPCQDVCETGVDCDCDDADAEINPGQKEECDGFDNNCRDGTDDEYYDLDEDSFYPCNPGNEALQDCDDEEDTVYPGADELCDGQPNNCDDLMLPDDETDGDFDGYVECDLDEGGWDGDGSMLDGGDCDDGDPAINPAAIEVCDGLDNDCDDPQNTDNIDRALDLEITNAGLYFLDADGDGRGAPGTGRVECERPDGYVEDNDADCDDADPITYSGANEVCDGEDNNCDGIPDEGLEFDRDEDGYLSAEACQGLDGVLLDCDDLDPDVYPGASEIPDDGIDNDCDGEDAGDGSGGSPTAPQDEDVTWILEGYGCACSQPTRSPTDRPGVPLGAGLLIFAFACRLTRARGTIAASKRSPPGYRSTRSASGPERVGASQSS